MFKNKKLKIVQEYTDNSIKTREIDPAEDEYLIKKFIREYFLVLDKYDREALLLNTLSMSEIYDLVLVKTNSSEVVNAIMRIKK